MSTFLKNRFTLNPATRIDIEQARPDRITLAALATIVLFGGFNALAIRLSNAELAPFWGAALRFGGASVILLFIVLSQRLPLPRGRALAGAVLYGLFGIGLPFALGYWALVQISAGLTQVLLALVPLFTLFFAIAHGLERFAWHQLVGALIAVAGIAIVFGNQISANAAPLAMVAVVLAAACIAEAGVLVKSFPKSHPITTNAVAMTAGTALLLAASALSREPLVLPVFPATWVAVVYLVLIGSVLVFGLWLFVLKRWTASATSYQFVLFPFVTVAAGAWLQNETISAAFLLGGALVLSGVYVSALTHPSAPVQAQAPASATTPATENVPRTVPCNCP